jgi:hypothetical protein
VVQAIPDSFPEPWQSRRPPAVSLTAWKKAIAVKGVPAPGAACAAYAKRTPAAPPPHDVASALAEADPGKRDALLAALEPTEDKATAGRLRVLRADLAPVECADALVDPWLGARAEVSGEHGHAAIGLSLAGKLARTARGSPRMTAGGDKAKVAEFVRGPLKKWVVEQATAIEALSGGAAGLVGYGRGIAAIEAGNADLRLVDDIRSSPVPTEWDPELRQVYEIALDEALEPRKTRGRDAALVGLAELGDLLLLHDARVDRARAMLSKLYGGRRIDALDGLLLPPILTSGDRAVPSPPVALGILPPAVSSRPGDGPGRDDVLRGAVRRLDVGRTYWRRTDFVVAAYVARDAGTSAEARLVLALALALAHGPPTAAEMMRAPTPAALDLGHTEALDAYAAEGGPYAGLAAFDAAYLRALCPPQDDRTVAWLRDVAERFRTAASLLGDADADTRRAAEGRARDAEAAATAAAAVGRKP